MVLVILDPSLDLGRVPPRAQAADGVGLAPRLARLTCAA